MGGGNGRWGAEDWRREYERGSREARLRRARLM